MVALLALLASRGFACDDARRRSDDSSATWYYPYNAAAWGEVSATCESGTSQSPIDLPKYKGGNRGELAVEWSTPVGLTASRPHSTVKWTPDGETNTILFPNPSWGIAESKEFTFVQVHCHTGSENAVEGKQYAGECHFVHADANGTLLVVGLFLEEGSANTEFEKLLDPLADNSNWDNSSLAGTFVIADLVEGLDLGEYWTFSGSLTTPPCSEGVQWIVLKEAREVSKDQIAKIVSTSGEDANYRPTQPLNGRMVGGSESVDGENLDWILNWGLSALVLALAMALIWTCCKKPKKRSGTEVEVLMSPANTSYTEKAQV